MFKRFKEYIRMQLANFIFPAWDKLFMSGLSKELKK